MGSTGWRMSATSQNDVRLAAKPDWIDALATPQCGAPARRSFQRDGALIFPAIVRTQEK
jgi:hypothetical protein